MKGKSLPPPTQAPGHVVFCAKCPHEKGAIEPGEPLVWQRGWWLHPACSEPKKERYAFSGSTRLLVRSDGRPGEEEIGTKDRLYGSLKEIQKRVVQRQMELEASLRRLEIFKDRVNSLIEELDQL